jgi:hypothetical protein
MMVLPAVGWLPVQVSREIREIQDIKSAEDGADFSSHPSAVDSMEEEEDALVAVVNESECVAEACGILTGELEPEPFPAKEAPCARQLGTRTVPTSPAEYLLKVERQLLIDSTEARVYAKFLAILREFKSQIDGGALYSQTRRTALAQLTHLLQKPPRNQLLYSLAAFLREHPTPVPGEGGGGEGGGGRGRGRGRGGDEERDGEQGDGGAGDDGGHGAEGGRRRDGNGGADVGGADVGAEAEAERHLSPEGRSVSHSKNYATNPQP